MKLADFSVKRPVTIVMLVIAIIIFGMVSLPKLSVDLYPEMNLPVAVVVTSYPGATPTEVENLVTKPIEEVIGTVSNIKDLSSVSIGDASQVILMFNWGTDMDQATLDMRDKIDQVAGFLPDGAKNPRVLKLDINAMPVLTLTLSGDQDLDQLKAIAEDLIKPRLERIEGIASVGISGGLTRELQVILDQNKLQAYSLTVDQVQQAIQSENFAGSAGAVYEGNQMIRMRVDGEFKGIEELKHIPIRLASGGSITLTDVANVVDGQQEVMQRSYVNGEPTLGLTITKATGGNTVQVADAAFKELEKIKTQLPAGVELSTILDLSKYIKDSISTVAEHALFGGIFAVIVLLLFLGSVRSTLVVAITIPISIVATFCLMFFTGQTINLITLGGLTLGLGSLVDFAVVVLENVYRHRQMGKNMIDSAVFGTQEVGTAVMASALAQCAVFIPIVFVEGLASILFGPLALVVIYSHIAALLAAITLVPMMSSKMLKKVPSKEEELARYQRRTFNPFTLFNKYFYKLTLVYGAMIRWALRFRKTVITLTTLLLIASLAMFPLIGAEFMPEMDQGEITINTELPNGTRLDETEKVAQRIESIIEAIPERDIVYTVVGGGTGPAIVNESLANRTSTQLILVPLSERERSTAEIVEEIRAHVADIAGAEVTVQATDAGGGMGSPLEISIQGDDLTTLKDISEMVIEEIKTVEGTRNLQSSLASTQAEYVITVNKQLAHQYGLGTAQVMSAMRTAFDGQTVTKYRTGDDEIDVKLMYERSIREERSNVNQLMITSPLGMQIPLSMIAKIEKQDVPQAINRFNQTREVKITGDIFGRDLQSVTNDVNERLAKLHLPDGYLFKVGGQAADMAESFGSLGLAIILSVILVYMVMASQFESLFHPFVIMFSVPPTFIGVVVGLLVTGHKLSVTVLIGLILLVGIVVNNAIVLIDFVNTLRRRGVARKEAILEAGAVRLRPIMMTSITTVVALLPMAFAGGEGNEGTAPMAVVVVFGLTFSTLITLILVPVVYDLLDDWMTKIKGWFTRKKKDNALTLEGSSNEL